MFERYVNFEFYKTDSENYVPSDGFERYVKFEFYKTEEGKRKLQLKFERYVNFEFYKTNTFGYSKPGRLRDM